MKLTKLQQLTEDTGGKAKVLKIMNPLGDKAELAFDSVNHIMQQLESSVLTDLLKQEGFPATESKAAKAAAKAAFEAVKKLANELDDLHQALGMHFEE